MPIEVDIPLEIDSYERKIVFGMTGRQLICLPAAIVLTVATFFLLIKHFGISIDTAGWIIIFEALPLLALGFIKPQGEAFEKFFYLRLRRQFGWNRLYYETDIEWFTNLATGGKKHGFKIIPRKVPCGYEYITGYYGGQDRKAKRKQAKQRIAAAKKEYHEAKKR